MTKNILKYLLILFFGLIVSCDDGPPILPGLTKSQVVVKTSPEGATVIINGKSAEGITPVYIDKIEPGFYKIDVKKDTYLDTTFYLIFQRGRTDTLITELREDPAYWWKIWKTANGLPTGSIVDLTFDNSGSLWISTNGGGVAKLTNNTFQIFNSSNSGLPSNFIRQVFFDHVGNTWVATSLGIAKYDGASWTKFTTANTNIIDNFITSITQDKNNVLWFGTASGGLVSFDGVRFKVFTKRNSGIPSDYITSIVVDASNNKWIGTYGEGLVKFDDVNWEVFHQINSSLMNNYINHLYLDQQGMIWIASGTTVSPGTLSKYDGTNFRHYFNSSFLIINKITSAVDGTLWVGTSTGLYHFVNNNWITYSVQNSGLPNNSVTAITIDNEGNKWAGGSSGLAKYIGGK
ncbi:MAG: two-component regulator propeller domain-containing protein [Ignavibacteria bacterium]|nr:two-component regulator propeller domain-containing protein [Ignavibacteria bacterium]